MRDHIWEKRTFLQPAEKKKKTQQNESKVQSQKSIEKKKK